MSTNTTSFAIAIHTQYMENYGTAELPYWKYKGGSTVILTDVVLPMTHDIGTVAEALVKSVLPKIEYRNDYAESYMLDWEIVPADYRSEDEQLQMRFDGRIDYPDTRISMRMVA